MKTVEKNKKIGMWGFGVTGKASVIYLHKLGYKLTVLEKKPLAPEEQDFLHTLDIQFYTQDSLLDFLAYNDYILPSPGIDLRPYASYAHKMLNELDIFYEAWNKPIIAITGSIGKTTVTHLLCSLIEHAGLRVALGGNIGIPMFELLAHTTKDVALLEVSSFQLEHCKTFAPDLSIITNLHPNHLDRHESIEKYLAAKAQIMTHQTPNLAALIPFNLKEKISHSQKTYFFSTTQPSIDELATLSSIQTVFYIDNDIIMAYRNGKYREIIACIGLPPITFMENWLILCSILDICKIELPNFKSLELTVPEHRLEKIATINGVDFYNDSKSTTTQSTLAAIDRLKYRPILLILGGLSKGVNRKPFIQTIGKNVKKIYCFGAEADELKSFCDEYHIVATAHQTLEQAVKQCIADMHTHDQILLSPAGSSYDLYSNYIERGNHFKKLIQDLQLTVKE